MSKTKPTFLKNIEEVGSSFIYYVFPITFQYIRLSVMLAQE